MPARIVIVDPDQEGTRRLARALQELGHETLTARDAEQALESTGFDPDVLVTEVHLPGLSGLDLVAALKERGSRSRAILIASTPSFGDCRAAWKLGAVEFLAKPVDPAALQSAVDRALLSETHSTHALELRASTSTDDVRRAAREVVAFALRCGARPAARARLGGAVAEILDNVLRHAYPAGAGEFRLTARRDDETIAVRVVDEGTGFDTVRARLEHPAALHPVEENLPGGLARAAALVESLCVESSRSGTRVTLRVAMTPASFDCEATTDLSDLDFMEPALAKRILRALRRGPSGDPFNLSPPIAVTIGRLLAGATPTQQAEAALWS